ncbi:hypothetical protein I4U23_023797 [Adineta vaga]|nr:hypothetical protein I4U23_023797 [Adineta vaga]
MHFLAILRYIKIHIVNLNLFETIDTVTDPNRLRTAIISTRIYILLLTSAVFILSAFTALGQYVENITVRNPSQDVFQNLYSAYSSTLHCPCSHVEVPYETFINISYKFHPVCSSIFVSERWINLLFSPDMTYYHPFDFRSTGTNQFQLLASLCLFANRILQDAVDDFLSTALLSPQVLSISSLTSQTEVISEFVKTSTIYTFRRLLNLVRDTTQMNGLQPAMQTSKMHLLTIYPNGSLDAFPLETVWDGDNNEECFCGISSNCYAQSRFLEVYAEETEGALYVPDDFIETVTGIVVGCYALESLLKSALSCFFNSSCFNIVLTFFPATDITILDTLKANQTKFSPETNVETLAQSLFLEYWSAKTSFAAYYSTCAPILCTYKLTKQNSFLQILTTLLGVYGGLTLALRMCIPHMVHNLRNRHESDNTVPLMLRIRRIYNKIKVRIIELNLFKTAESRIDPYELQTAKITTRVYIITLLSSLLIIIIYLLLSSRVYTVTVLDPPREIFQTLYEKYPSTLRCPCTRIANAYELFISLSPIYHPICSSLYISEGWIISISSLNIVDSDYDEIDFRVAGPTFFNSLTTLCSLSKVITTDSWYSFSRSSFITDSAVSTSDFQTQIMTSIEQFQKNTISEFHRILALVELHTKTMYTTGYSSVLLHTDELSTTEKTIDFKWKPVETNGCSCGIDDMCDDVMSFFYYTGLDITTPYYLNFTLPDILISCVVLSSVLRSSLSCFFNQTCLDIVQEEIKSDRSIDIPILNTNQTRYSSHSLVGIIMDNLMIESWNENISYENYYDRCAPAECIYSYTARNNPLETITKLVGLFGGLSIGLRIIVSMIIRPLRNRLRKNRTQLNTTDSLTNSHRMIRMSHAVKRKILNFNLLKSELSWNDNQRQRREIITTRLYLLLLIIVVSIMIIYTFIETQTEIVKILDPAQDEFDRLRLHPQYSTTLDCPCKNIIVTYQSFMSIQPYYHQLCSSDFIRFNSIWTSLLYSSTASLEYSYDDYRLFAVSHFRLLSSFCTLANDTVTEAIIRFSRNTITTQRVQSRETIEQEANTILKQFLISTPRTFVLTLDFIRYMNQGNGIVSSILSNWHFFLLHANLKWATLWALPLSYATENCTCGTSPMCISSASFAGRIIPGLHVGCYPLESLLQSTLECLYNITCIDQLKSMYGPTNLVFRPLNDTLSSRNDTIQSLIDTLLVDSWTTKVVYEHYYSTCAPLWCTYTYSRSISPVYTITIIIGLFGGLSVVLKLITPLIIQIGYHIIRYRRQQITNVVSTLPVAVINTT